ncbi:unnamed protein product, partial [Rotaria sp. Silwood1]
MPAIVLINPGQAGSLLGVLKTPAEEEAAAIWVEPAYIRVLELGEYFYKSNSLNSSIDNNSLETREHMVEFDDFQTHRLKHDKCKAAKQASPSIPTSPLES